MLDESRFAPLINASSALAAAPDEADTTVRVLESSARTMVVAFSADTFNIAPLEQEGTRFHRVLMPGTEQTTTPGKPQVPSIGTLLGVSSLTGSDSTRPKILAELANTIFGK